MLSSVEKIWLQKKTIQISREAELNRNTAHQHDHAATNSLFRLKSVRSKSETKLMCSFGVSINSEFNEMRESSKTSQGKN